MVREVVNLADHVVGNIADWRHKATVFAFTNPIGFWVTMGVTLPQYLMKLNQLEETYRKVQERVAL